MEHLALEVFDLATKENPKPTGSKYAVLASNTRIHIRRNSQIFGKGDVWTHSFNLNIAVNAHLFGTAGDIHGSRLHEQLDKRRARLWVEGIPLYLGYLRLDEDAEVDEDENVEVSFESGKKTFDDMIEGTSARDVSVGDAVIGVALNRKRAVTIRNIKGKFKLVNLPMQTTGDEGKIKRQLEGSTFYFEADNIPYSPFTHRWPKLVLSKGRLTDYSGTTEAPVDIDYTNIHMPYDSEHPFCNVNVCYQRKQRKEDDTEETLRDYINRLARGDDTTTGGDGQTRFNNAPNFYLLHFLNRLFIDLGIHITENQMLNVEDLRRVFLANLGCFYEEMDLNNDTVDNYERGSAEWKRYGKYSFPDDFITKGSKVYLDDDDKGKVYVQRLQIEGFNDITGQPGIVTELDAGITTECQKPTGYLAYATGENYPNVEISEIIRATESAFGVRFLFSDDFSNVRIVLLRNIFRQKEVQHLSCHILSESKTENSIRGFIMTYGQDKDNTYYFYKGFDDALPKRKDQWPDKSDQHDYSKWNLNSTYYEILNKVTAFNKTCYVTPINGNAYGVKIDEEEELMFPSLFSYADFADAQDGICTGEEETIDTVTVNATPLIMNAVDDGYSVFMSGEMKAPGKAELAAQIPTTNIEETTAAKIVSHIYHKGGRDEGFVYSYDYFDIRLQATVYIKEGYEASLQDNYSFTGNDGTPFDKVDLGLCFGVMRGSGDNAYIDAKYDDIEDEGNEYWQVVPGNGAIVHPDTCDNYGKEWIYDAVNKEDLPDEDTGDSSSTVVVKNKEEALRMLSELFPNSNAPFYTEEKGYITDATVVRPDWISVEQAFPGSGVVTVWAIRHIWCMFASSYSITGTTCNINDYITWITQHQGWHNRIREIDAGPGGKNLLIELGYWKEQPVSSFERRDTLLDLCKKAYGDSEADESQPIIIDNGVSAKYGRFSLKLRAEKPNPYYVAGSTEEGKSNQYLQITNQNLRGRGLCDQFYKDYSYFIRNARIYNAKLDMGIAELMTLDDTVLVQVGDITGFIKDMAFDVDIQSGLQPVEMKLLYI